MIVVNKLVDEDEYQGVGWLGARFANTVLFRPSVLCVIERTQSEIRSSKFRNKLARERAGKEVKIETSKFAKLVKQNKEPFEILATAKLVKTKRKGADKLVEAGRRLEEAYQQLEELKLLQDEAKVQQSITSIISHMVRGYDKRGAEQAGIRYEIEKARIDAIHDMYHESWTGDEDESMNEDDFELVEKLIVQNNIERPEKPIFDVKRGPVILPRPVQKGKGKEKRDSASDLVDELLNQRHERLSQ